MAAAVTAPSELWIGKPAARPRLVLDPWLCLQPAGPALVQRLQARAELWLSRELFHILDSSHFYGSRPQALFALGEREALELEYQSWLAEEARGAPGDVVVADGALPGRGSSPAQRAQGQVAQVMRVWEQTRLASDLNGLRLFWLGDGLSESLLPEGTSPGLHACHEWLVGQLDALLMPRSAVACAQRDALALSLALDPAPILTCLGDAGAEPGLCGELGHSSLRCERVLPGGRVAELERDAWHALLAETQCGPLLWAGLGLALVHAHAPLFSAQAVKLASEAASLGVEAPEPLHDLRLYWYPL